MRFFKYLLLPVQIIYGIIISIRNILYDLKILKTHRLDPIIISIGNIKSGGTGKTPLVEYVIKLINNENTAVLSRGYGRKTSGFILANDKQHAAFDIGDENSQLYHKFKNTAIACHENRVEGVKELLKRKQDIKIVVLDDAYQHRQIHRDLNILLTEYDKPINNDCLIPIGLLRESKREIKRADIIIVTKCSKLISEETKKEITQSLKLKHNQKIYFSYIKKYVFINMDTLTACDINTEKKYILLTGIENPEKLLDFLSSQNINTHHLKFKDHYNLKNKDVEKIINLKKHDYCKQLLLTEKDYYRLSKEHLQKLKQHFTLICIQIEIDFINENKSDFNNQLLKFVN